MSVRVSKQEAYASQYKGEKGPLAITPHLQRHAHSAHNVRLYP